MPDLSQFFADLDLPSRKPCKPSHTEAYLRYLASEEWQRQREAALERADRMCQRCYEDNPYLLQVHHLTYAHARLGHERPEDLQVLCTFCHDQEHRRQRTAGEAAYEDELWIRRVEDWRFRRYGEAGIWNWAEVEDEFEDWLDGREYW